MTVLDFESISAIEEKLLAAKLDGLRFSISHAGEKGRALEYAVRKLLREFLPPEYGLTTGFVAWRSETGIELSSQLDIILYDAIRHAPLIHSEAFDVLPLEAVYGYVEVKASLVSTSDKASAPAANSIEACLAKNSQLRRMRDRYFHAIEDGSPIVMSTFKAKWLAIRAYVVAFEASGEIANDPGEFAGRMSDVLAEERDAHIHGVLILNRGFFYTKPVDNNVAREEDRFHVRYTVDRPLLAFKALLLQALTSFERPPREWAPAIDLYFTHKPRWLERVPNRARDKPDSAEPA